MTTLANDIRAAIARRLESTTPQQVMAIASSLLTLDAADETAVSVSPRATGTEPLPRFSLLDEHQVLDRCSGLIWTRGNVPGGRMTWADAKSACEKLSVGGHSGWRLPTIRELQGLVDFERHEPAIDTNVFECESSWYWSSTPLHSSPSDCAWGVDFDDGDSGYGDRDGYGFVRAVRVGT